MKQLVQQLRNGKIQVLDVPESVLHEGQILVQNHFSVISAGTEGSTVNTARKTIIGKAKERPQQVKQVVDVLKVQGPVQTYRAVMKKLQNYSPLGYSSAGTVIDVDPGVRGFQKGDRVACAGVGYANHAEIVAVPQNLCVKLNKDANLEHAAYNTVGAIAMQGIRQAHIQLGETCLVVGLGLIGQLTCLLLRSAGARVIGIDIREEAIMRAQNNCSDIAISIQTENVIQRIEEFTQNIGADAAIITAATSSSDPVNLAGKCLRHRGKVVIVGNASTDFDRETFYQKELELKMSCSYGPGRYDPNYEELGIDYPVGFVRWTEKRNMEAFQHLLIAKRIDLNFLTTHRFKLNQAPQAFDILLDENSDYCGIVIEYDTEKPINILQNIRIRPSKVISRVNVGFIGAGSYAMNHLLPNVKSKQDTVLKGVMTSRGSSSRSVAERYGFEFCTAREEDIIGSENINTIVVSTRHDSHSLYVQKILKAGQNVFVEKPLCLSEIQLNEITKVIDESSQKKAQPILMVGFNRRFSSLSLDLKEKFNEGPMSMIYRINAGAMDSKSWMQIEKIGGGRIIGECCHFIDYLTFINGSLPTEVFATIVDVSNKLEDVANIHLRFENGSTGSIFYFSNGAKKLPKEHIEVVQQGKTAIIDDFKKLVIYGKGKKYQKKLLIQDKGQANTLSAFIEAIRNGEKSPVPYNEVHASMQATFRAVKSIRTSKPYPIDNLL